MNTRDRLRSTPHKSWQLCKCTNLKRLGRDASLFAGVPQAKAASEALNAIFVQNRDVHRATFAATNVAGKRKWIMYEMWPTLVSLLPLAAPWPTSVCRVCVAMQRSALVHVKGSSLLADDPEPATTDQRRGICLMNQSADEMGASLSYETHEGCCPEPRCQGVSPGLLHDVRFMRKAAVLVAEYLLGLQVLRLFPGSRFGALPYLRSRRHISPDCCLHTKCTISPV